MHLKDSCQMQAFMHNKKAYFVITKLKARKLRYFHKALPQSTTYWMIPEYWAEYEAGLEDIFDKYEAKHFVDGSKFQINSLINVMVKCTPMQKQTFHVLNIEKYDDENLVPLVFECIIEHSDNKKNTLKYKAIDEEYQPKGDHVDTYAKYIPAKKQKCSPSKDEHEPYEVICSRLNANYTPSPIKSRKTTSESKKVSDIEIRASGKKCISEDHDSSSTENSTSLTRSVRTTSKERTFSLDHAIKKRSNKRAENKYDNNQKSKERKITIEKKITSSSKKRKLIEAPTCPKEANKKTDITVELKEKNYADNAISKYPTNEELEEEEAKVVKELKDNEKISEFLAKLAEPPPLPVEFMPLHHLKNDEILTSFDEFKSVFDDIVLKLHNKSRISHYNGVNHYVVMGLISEKNEGEMIIKLGDAYDTQLQFHPKIQLYTNALLPEWILRLFMKKHNMRRSEAIKQIVAQKKYKLYKEAENNDYCDLF